MYIALSVVRPFGDLIISRRKTLEIRSWIPQGLPLKNVVLVQNYSRLSTKIEEEVGFALGLIDIDGFHLWKESDLPESGCDTFYEGYYAWEIGNRRPFVERQEIVARRKFYRLDQDESRVIDHLVCSSRETRP